LTEKKAVITQRSVPADVQNFEDGIKSLLRQDPDVIFIGEVRPRSHAPTPQRGGNGPPTQELNQKLGKTVLMTGAELRQ